MGANPETIEAADRVPSLANAGVVEDLVGQGRIPRIVGVEVGVYLPTGGIGRRQPFFAFIPPEGTQIGDSYDFAFDSIEYFSPGGKSRGYAAIEEINDPRVAAGIRERIRQAIG